MNPINKFFLYVLLLPEGFYQKMGVNTTQLHAILNTKLVMDDRRPNNIHQTRQKKQPKPISYATIGTMLFSAILGTVFLMGFGVGKDDMTRFTIYFSFYIFVLASTLISDFTSVLIDVRDNMIILPKPINDKTFVLARLLHIITHVSKIVVPMTIPGMIYISVKHSIAGLVPFIFLVISSTLFTIFLINAVYILILQVTTPQKFKSIISYFQIVFAILFYGGYQLVPRLIGKAALDNYTITSSSWAWLVPSYWFAGSWQFMLHTGFAFSTVTSFFVTLVLPVFCMWIVIRFFAPSFNERLSMISGSDGEPAAVKEGAKKVLSTTSAYVSKLAEWFTKKGPERMAFLHTWKMTGRSRDFKMKVYPSFGYLLVYIVIMFLNERRISLGDIRNQTGGGRIVFIGVIYFSSFMLLMAIGQLPFSEKYKAAWIYYVTPIKSPGNLLSGAVKSIMAKFFVPMIICITVVAVTLAGPKVIPNIFLGMCNLWLIITCVAYITMRELPFGCLQSMSARSGGFIKGLFSLIIPGILAVIHFILYNYMPVIIVLGILSAVAGWLVMDGLRGKAWSGVTQRNYE